MTFNGWENRETWAVNVLISNDEGLWTDCEDFLAAFDGSQDIGTAFASWFDNILAAWHENAHHSATALDFYVRCLEDIGSLWRVDWDELGAALLADYRKDNPKACECGKPLDDSNWADGCCQGCEAQ